MSIAIFPAHRPNEHDFEKADMFVGSEEIDGDDDVREEFPCPFCSEYFDIIGLCCHIDDEHPMEAKNGVSLNPPFVADSIHISLAHDGCVQLYFLKSPYVSMQQIRG